MSFKIEQKTSAKTKGQPELNLDDVKQMIETAKNKAVQEAKDEMAKQIQTDKATLITIFGIFASIVSFLTIEFQFLKNLPSIEKILGFSCILFSLLLGFNIGLDYLIKSRLYHETPKPHKYFYLLIFCLFVLGIIFTAYKEIIKMFGQSL